MVIHPISAGIRNSALRLLLSFALLSIAAQAAMGTAPASAAPKKAQPVRLQDVLSSSDLAVGRNRFTFGLLNNNHPLSTGRPRLTFYFLRGNDAIRQMSTTAYFNFFARGLKDTAENSAAIEIQGVYVSYPVFRQAGKWGVEIDIPYQGQVRVLRDAFTVRQHSLTPAVGSSAPRSHNPTIYQLPASRLDSARPPTDMHRLSIAQAIAQHKPLVVIFATAGFCTSRMCGPEIEVVQGLERQYRGRVNFVHIEIYQDANPAHGYAPAVLQWHLQTEPWVFVVNRKGFISAKFEGPTPASEIRPAIQAVLR